MSDVDKVFIEEELATFMKIREDEDKLIERYGYVIIGITDGGDSFSYTIGRNDSSNPDFVTDGCNDIIPYIIQQAIEITSKEEITECKIFESEVSFLKKNQSERSKFMLCPVSVDKFKDKVLGVMIRYKDDSKIKLIEIIPADADNNFVNRG